MTNKKNGTLYIGVTNNLFLRTQQHKEQKADGFTVKCAVKKLVYYEMVNDPITAITREKQLKNWKREWKIALIEKNNPEWNDLYETLI